MKKNTKGSSMVSVIAAFVILMIGMGMVYTSIMFAKNLTSKAIEVRKKTEETVASYYEGTGESKGQFSSFTLKGDDNSSIKVKGKLVTYTAKNKGKVYSFVESTGDGWHIADDILAEFDKNVNAGKEFNQEIKDKNGGVFPSVTDEEVDAAQNAINKFFEDQDNIPVVPTAMVWKANTVNKPGGGKTYFLWATTDTDSAKLEGWNTVLLCIDGRMFVSTKTNYNNTKIDPVSTAFLHAYTKEKILQAWADGEGLTEGKNDQENLNKFIEVNF